MLVEFIFVTVFSMSVHVTTVPTGPPTPTAVRLEPLPAGIVGFTVRDEYVMGSVRNIERVGMGVDSPCA